LTKYKRLKFNFMPQFPLCSEFIPLLDTVKKQLAELKILSQEFLRSGDDVTKQKSFLKAEELEKTKRRFIELKEQPVEFEGNQISRIEKELMVFFRSKMFDHWLYKANNSAVSAISVGYGTSSVALEQCLKYLKLFGGLQKFRCNYVEITSMPELPNSLQYFEYHSIPAAKNPETKKQLEEFKKNHPQFSYEI